MKKLISVLLALLVLLPAVSGLCPAPCAAADTAIVIIKHPYGETVTEGDDTMFVSRAENYTGLVWLFVSPDGETVYQNEEALDAFPGLEMGSCEIEELELFSIPYTLNGWYIQTRFLDAAGNAVLTNKALIEVKRGKVPSPGVTYNSPGARLTVGQSRTLSVEAYSPGQDELKYQWYSSSSSVRSAGEPIPGATASSYTPPEEIGQIFYFVGVWCVRGRETSAPIYTAPVAIVYSAAEPTPEPEPTPAPTPAPTPPSNRGGANPLIDSGSAVGMAITALLALTLLAVTVAMLVLHALNKRQNADDEEDEYEEEQKTEHKSKTKKQP